MTVVFVVRRILKASVFSKVLADRLPADKVEEKTTVLPSAVSVSVTAPLAVTGPEKFRPDWLSVMVIVVAFTPPAKVTRP